MKVLFITWDGPQVTYLESLFLPIFTLLAKEGISFQILQFTWGDINRIDLTRQACQQAGFGYEAVTIWRWPRAMGALLTALMGAWHVMKALKNYNINLVMARSTLPAISTMLALRNRQSIFMLDADGLPLDERVDFASQSPSGLMHRLLRDIEAQAVRRADVVLTRSAKASDILLARAGAGTLDAKFHVVKNGRDAALFKPAEVTSSVKLRRDLGLGVSAPLIVYAGSLGGQYCIDEMLRLFGMIHERRSDSHFLILTGSPEAVPPVLEKYIQIKHYVTTLSVSAEAVPGYVGCADLGLALRQPSFSMQAVAPIKLGEYLLCGLPVVATKGIGETNTISLEVGMLLSRLEDADLKSAADWFIDTVIPQREKFRESARVVGLDHFSLEVSRSSYLKAFEYLGVEISVGNT